MRIGKWGFRALLALGPLALLLALAFYPWPFAALAGLALTHLLLAAWMIYRAPTWPAGLTCAACTFLLGVVFVFPYLLLAHIAAKGDMRVVLLGEHQA